MQSRKINLQITTVHNTSAKCTSLSRVELKTGLFFRPGPVVYSQTFWRGPFSF